MITVEFVEEQRQRMLAAAQHLSGVRPEDRAGVVSAALRIIAGMMACRHPECFKQLVDEFRQATVTDRARRN